MARTDNTNTLDRTSNMELSAFRPESEPGVRTQPGVTESSTSVLPRHRQDVQSSGALVRSHGTAIDASNARHHVADATKRIPHYDIPEVDVAKILVTAQKVLHAEAKKTFSPEKLTKFYADRDAALKSDDFDAAIQSFLDLHDINDAEQIAALKKGFETGGIYYGLRNLKGNLLNLFFPLLMPYLIKHASPGGGGVVAATVNLAGIIATGVYAMRTNADTLLHITPLQDLAFKGGAPNIAEALKEMNLKGVATPEAAAGKLAEAINVPEYQHTHLESLYLKARQNPQDPALLERAESAFKTAEQAIKTTMLDYQIASLFVNIYHEGLERQCYMQGFRMYANMVATWAAYQAGHPIGGWYVAGTTALQTAVQPYVARGDKINEQYAQMKLNIAKGDNPDSLKSAWRSPYAIRALQLESIFKDQLKEQLPKEASKLLGLSKQDWAQYQELDMRRQSHVRWTQLDDQYARASGKFSKEDIEDLKNQILDARSDKNFSRERDLCKDLAGKIGMRADDCWEHHNLSQRESLRQPLEDDAEVARYLDLQQLVQRKADDLNTVKEGQYAAVIRQYQATFLDPIYVQEQRLDEISSASGHRQAAAAFMDPERRDSFLDSPDYRIGYKLEGARRGNDHAESGAGLIGGMARTYQLGIANIGGAILVGAIMTLVDQIKKLDNPKYKESAGEHGIGTVIMGTLLLLNAAAVISIRRASAIRMNKMQIGQMAMSSASSTAETTYQIAKLNVRELLRLQGSSGNKAKDLWTILSLSAQNMILLAKSGVINIKTSQTIAKAETFMGKLEEIGKKLETLDDDAAKKLIHSVVTEVEPELLLLSRAVEAGPSLVDDAEDDVVEAIEADVADAQRLS